MAITSMENVTAAKRKQIKASTGGSGGGCGGLVNNGLKKSSLLYIPRQVLMNWSADITTPASDTTKANIKLCDTGPSSSSSKMNGKILNAENRKSTIDQRWSPLMDGIVRSIPRCLIANCSLSNGTAALKDSKKLNIELAIKILDEYIDKVLYGPKKSSLPALEKIRHERLTTA